MEDIPPRDPRHPLEDEIYKSLDMDGWSMGPDVEDLAAKLKGDVHEAIEKKREEIELIRNEVLPKVELQLQNALAYPTRGTFDEYMIMEAQNGLVFNGDLHAVHSIQASHDTMPLSVAQIGICLVSYEKEAGTYSSRIYKKDLRARGQSPMDELMARMNENRKSASGSGADKMTVLARRGLRAYAERSLLLDKVDSRWRMGHGNPITMELLTDYWGNAHSLGGVALDMLKKLVEFERFVFVADKPTSHAWALLGNALKPGEYIIVDTLDREMMTIELKHKLRNKAAGKFLEKYGTQVVFGLYRASVLGKPQMFYAHRKHARTAALIAVADSVLQDHRGAPMLLELAHSICQATFDRSAFQVMVRQAYADAGLPFRFM